MSTSAKNAPLLVVAGERSGDWIAARALSVLRDGGEVSAFGLGGDALAELGVELVAHVRDLAAIGVGAVAARLGAWVSAWARLREEIGRRRPRAALLVDAPDVNLPLARILTEQGVAVLQYVGPQIWAWRPRRLRLLASRTRHVALVLPFEKPLYDAAGVRASYVGHPLLDAPAPAARAATRLGLGIGEGAPLVALLPGSRRGEVSAHAAPMSEAARILARHGVRTAFVPAAESASPAELELARGAGCVVPGGAPDARDVLAASDAALVASGTATLEAALLGVPLAVVYRLGFASRTLARALVDAPYVGLPNWIAGCRAVPELLGVVEGDRLARTALELLEPEAAASMRRDFDGIRAALGPPGAARRVAKLLREL
ncbi:MAG: lipid-A-disaccharide synthase [Proteobacteria bacterium]|jgi:lipid-A-disaccharide synthase|nr:lipid-A-disaccharide synthase [Pseudomonadota bacterium]